MSCQEKSDYFWTYDSPSEWSTHFPHASGICQSPINIVTKETKPESYSPFSFSMQYTCDQLFTLTHSGQQVAATLTDKQHASEIWFTGSGLGGRFHFINFHLHWGENNRHGSEHEIDGHRFPAEAHFVHRNHENGQVAVLACFFTAVDEEQSTQNPWKQFTQVASRLTETHQIDHCTFNLSQLMSIQDRPFYRYHGSLTTPPCTEGVLWTVFAHEIPIEEDSLDLLRHNLLRKVYRPVQPLNGRTVFRNYNSSTTI